MANQRRKSSQQRREEIVAATLELLAEFPPGEVSTRDVAARVGISQPAIFKHFDSRDALFSAVVESVREALRAEMTQAFRADSALTAVGLLCERLLEFAASHPGLPRLLVFDVSQDGGLTFHQQLRVLVSRQRSVFRLLLDQAVAAQQLPRLDTERAAFALSSLLQGTLLAWLHGGRHGVPGELARAGIEQWFSAVQMGVPSLRFPEDAASSEEDDAQVLHHLDVRPLLAKGEDPLSAIIEALTETHSRGLLEVMAPFEPGPLLALMTSRGALVNVTHLQADLVRLWIRKDPAVELFELAEPDSESNALALRERAARLEPGASMLAFTQRPAPRSLARLLREQNLDLHTRPATGGGTLCFVLSRRQGCTVSV